MSTKVINCGERAIQKAFRIALSDICQAHGLKPGDRVEVEIKIKSGDEKQ